MRREKLDLVPNSSHPARLIVHYIGVWSSPIFIWSIRSSGWQIYSNFIRSFLALAAILSSSYAFSSCMLKNAKVLQVRPPHGEKRWNRTRRLLIPTEPTSGESPPLVLYEVGLVEFPAFAHEAISHFVPAYRALDKRMHNSRWLNGGVLILSKSLGSWSKAAITDMLFFSPLFVCRYWSRKVIWEAWWIECLDCSTTRPHSRKRPEIIY